MSENNIKTRDARIADAPSVARLLVSAWPVEDFLAKCGGLDEEGFIGLISQAVAERGNIYSFENTVVAVQTGADGEERVVGAMNGYDGSFYQEGKKPVTRILEKYMDGIEDFESNSETGKGEFYLDSIGVAPDMRSRGIGTLLFEAMFVKAHESGLGVASLIVDPERPKAEALYRRLGFEVVGTKMFFEHEMKHMQKKV